MPLKLYSFYRIRSTRLQPRRATDTLRRMGYLIGTDEAGYGPNLGPLVISATAWEVPDGVGNEDLHERLAGVIAPRPEKGDSPHLCEAPKRPFRQMGTVPFFRGPRVAMADSKSLYTPGKGLRNLELGLWAALAALDLSSPLKKPVSESSGATAGQASSGTLFQRAVVPRSWRDLWRDLAPGSIDRMRSIPWCADYDEPAPIDCDAEQCAAAAETLRAGLADAGVKLIAVRSRAVFEEEFNSLVERYGSKGTALSRQTLALAAEIIESLPSGPVSMVCDKHGGRNRYGPLLAKQFPDWVIEVRGEQRQASRYCFGPADRRVEVCFRTKAEACLPAALASMASKYLRELAMRAVNEFWRRRLPELRPTAGYPQDAKRFRADIAKEQQRLHISDRVLWRIV
ncbi:MAG: hypothetical protein K8R46_09400 [Pirellulales bacterium]|nr:hypothetical protein [Pirellulales bacterium]